jgi:hypothetical protein
VTKWMTLGIDDGSGEVLRIAGSGSMRQGVREMIEIYRELWALGYRPGLPLRDFVKRKRAPKGPKRSTAPPKYNPKREGQEGVYHT